ncbi:DUF3833 domain-containing protein [Amylibacter sp. IMCC11727]|uniref:DUF3833 domain-containing protein n=1 Tax=Amylibacter sp. IMCC11727 TaxID=3039851 RepID=UPI00244DD225|nr:DUF3833 domain-containing protein [Amylibacter sp. IMCC11727]WGI23500.1 DUF3833 domain-containing protein [Amylibacter sp. IMCC11727]
MFRYFGFKAQKPQDYVNGGPEFDIRTHLNGPLICEGVLYGPTGRVTSRFVADMYGTWDGNKGHLVENFHFDSGTKQKREWFLTSKNDGTFDAEAPDVIGTGEGVQMGSAIKLNYRIKLADAAGGHELETTDWMYLLDNGTLVNRSQMRKFGIKVAELVATIRRADA